MKLPIESIKEEFLKKLSEKKRIILQAATGSGKSTRIPLWLLEYIDGVTVILEPRRVACIALASYVASLNGVKCGEDVGYQVRFDSQISKKTRLIFMTPGLLLRRLADTAFVRQLSCIFFDEFHERQWQNDLLVAYLLYQKTELKLIFASATIDTQSLARKLDAYEIKAEGRTYPVTLEYDSEVLAPSLHQLERRIVQKVEQQQTLVDGNILVFLPGIAQINKCRNLLLGLENPLNIDVYVVHGSVDAKDLEHILSQKTMRDSKQYKQKVFLSSNIAESSLTIPDVSLVIDSGLEKRILHRQQKNVLALTACAQSSMDQRMGRAGRLAKGHCIRMFAQSFKAQKQRPPEIESMDVLPIIFASSFLKIRIADLSVLPWINPLPHFALKRAIEALQRIALLSKAGELNAAGIEAASYPFDPILSYYVSKTPVNMRSFAVWALVFTEKKVELLKPLHKFKDAEERGRIEEARIKLLSRSESKFEQYLRILKYEKWCVLGVNSKTYSDLWRFYRHCLTFFGNDQVFGDDKVLEKTQISPQKILDLGDYFAEANPEFLYVLRKRAQNQKMLAAKGGVPKEQLPYGNDFEEVFMPSFRPFSAEKVCVHRAVVNFSAFYQENDAGKIRGRSSWYIPCRMSQVSKLKLGEVHVSQVHIKRNQGNFTVSAHVKRVYAGVELGTEVEILEGAVLRDALLHLLQENKWLKGVYAKSMEAFWQYRLYMQAFPEKLKIAGTEFLHPNVDSFFKEQLSLLEINRCSEISLVEAEDVFFRVPDFLEHDADFIALCKDFPFELQKTRLCFAVEVNWGRKNVCLYPKKGFSKKDYKDPKASELPYFRGFSVDLKKASRKQRLR